MLDDIFTVINQFLHQDLLMQRSTSRR